MKNNKTVVIVGGVAGGASCATRLRRQDEYVRIILVERGPYVSFANCGLPYYIGDIIEEEESLLVADVDLFRDRFNVDARVEEEVVSVNREEKSVSIRRLSDGHVYEEHYDTLVLSPGAKPIRPPLTGIDLPGIFSLRNIPDSRQIKNWIGTKNVKHAVVIGGGFIGLEMVENLKEQGIEMVLIERDEQIMPPIDKEMSLPIQWELEKHDVTVKLGQSVTAFKESGNRLLVETDEGLSIETQMVITSIGVAPESDLASACGLEIGPRGHIVVDKNLRTSDRNILALGDAIEVRSAVIDQKTALPLAGPANRQGRIVADVITGRGRFFRGVQGTAVCGIFSLTMASTGASEKTLKNQTSIDYDVVYAHPNHHVGYYPGATPIYMKLLFDKMNGRVLGAQAVGESGVERRIDTIAMAIQMNATVFDLEESELCYAPQYGAAKDPVNIIGMIAANVMRGDLHITPWQDMGKNNAIVLDVRDPDEIECGPIPADIRIPLNQLRQRLDDLPKERPIQICCAVGARAYNATRLLTQHGFNTSLLSGGAETWFCVRE